VCLGITENRKMLKYQSTVSVMLGFVVSLLLSQHVIHLSSSAYAVISSTPIPTAIPQFITVQQDTNKSITLRVNGEAANFTYTLPTNGTLVGFNSPSVIYIPKPGFHGTDTFTFTAVNRAGNTSAPVKINVLPKPIITNVQERVAISYIISVIVVILVIIAAWLILKRSKPRDAEQYSKLSDIIRTEDWDPSLSIFQFLLWTIVVLFAFFAVYLIRIFGGVSTPPQEVPINLLALMGISVGVPIASNVVSSVRYSSPRLSTKRPDNKTTFMPPYSDMLKEYGKPTLSRFQMFGWTWIGIGVYLFVFFSKTIESMILVQNLILPDIDPTLVVLMGLSQTAFLGGKTVASRTEISQVFPHEGQIDTPVQIFGSNFGSNRDTIWFGDIPIRGNDIKTWTDDRIDFVVPKVIQATDQYPISVAVGGVLAVGESFKVTKTESTSVNTTTNNGSTGVAPSEKK
jgi:hypothetical protein